MDAGFSANAGTPEVIGNAMVTSNFFMIRTCRRLAQKEEPQHLVHDEATSQEIGFRRSSRP